MHSEIILLNKERNVTLTTYIQPIGGKFAHIKKRPAIIIFPGGAYAYCSDREAEPVAFAYLKAGFQVFILRYSLNDFASWPNPLNDYEQSMELIKNNADEWGIDKEKIAVIGFSAGGHLAAAAATMSKNRPNAALLGYAVAGEDVKGCNRNAPDTTKYVDRNTCPCFVFATRTDALVPIENSLEFISALAKHKIAFESHIYAYGPHGFSTCDTSIQSSDTEICERVPNWVNDSIGWLRDMFGEFTDSGFGKPKCSRYATHDYDEFLSLDCSIKHLISNKEACDTLGEIYTELVKMTEDEDASLVNKMTLRALLNFSKTDKELMNELDIELRKIENK